MNYKETLLIALEEVEALFKEHNFERLPENQFPSSGIIAAWKGSIRCEGTETIIIVAFPLGFPDELPKIYLTKDFQHLPIPHVDINRFVCTFDTENVDFFSEHPKGLTLQSIEKARRIIGDGIAGRNQLDFKQEFLAYWNTEASPLTLHSILIPGNSMAEVSQARVKSSNKEITFLIGSNRDDIIQYARRLDPKSVITDLKTCLYLPLPISPTPPFPKTNRDIFLFLRNIDPKLENSLLKFLLKNSYVGTVIASVREGGNVGFIGWLHLAPKKSLMVKGFRPGNISPSVFEQRTAALDITRYPVERIDAERLQRRIGNLGVAMKGKRICIVGVGSIGSNLAFDLAKAGVENLILVDPENLKPENVARHLCGMSETGSPKVQGVKRRIEQHLPHIRVEAHAKSLHQVLHDDPEELVGSDLIISATGVTAVERRLNQIQQDTSDSPPILYTWVEPYGVAAHAILIAPGSSSGCFECCLSDDLNNKFSVGMFQRGDATIREGGCQTSFTPYSAIDTAQASSLATRLVIKWFENKATQGARLVWLGDLDFLSSVNVPLNPMYSGKNSFSMHTFGIQKEHDCRMCGKCE